METTERQRTVSDLLGIPEASELLDIPQSTLRWYRTRGEGPKSFKVGRRVRYRREDCMAWVESQESASARGGVG
jgi:predicted DNA-binding transcriptional regulator AlpA